MAELLGDDYKVVIKTYLHTDTGGKHDLVSPFHGGNTGSIPVGVIFEIDVAYNQIESKAQ